MTRPNTHVDDLSATRLLRELESKCNPRPDLGVLILGCYLVCLGLFGWWVFGA